MRNNRWRAPSDRHDKRVRRGGTGRDGMGWDVEEGGIGGISWFSDNALLLDIETARRGFRGF